MSGGCRCYSPSVFALLPVRPGDIGSTQIDEDSGVPFFVDHIRVITASFDSELADVGKPLFQQRSRYLR